MHLGRIYYKQGRYKDAEMSFQKAQKCLAERPSNSVFYAEIMYWTAQVKMQQQQYQEAAVLCRNALVGIEKNLLPAHPLYIEIHDFIQERGTPKDNPQAVGRINRPVSTGAIALGRSLLPDVN
jgi:tetratricopeptide (TPR) repeat protein